jgi:ATP-dependent protease ClpP protease subunit
MKTIKRIHFPLELGNNTNRKLVEQFENASGKFDEIHLIIRSCGGCTTSAIEFVELIRKSKSKVIAFSDSFCDSSASLVFVSCCKRIITCDTTMTIHPQTITLKNERLVWLLESVEEFKNIEKEFIKTYSERTSLPKERIEKLCRCEEYDFNAEEMMQFGMADKMIQPTFASYNDDENN